MESRKHISLLELQEAVRNCLESGFPFSFWVTGEISEISENYSGHCYMELVEKAGKNAVPKAKAKAVIWRSTYGAVSSYFRAETGTDLAKGMKILFRATVSYHELYGLSLVVNEIDPLYTLGDMERQRQETVRLLQEEGVFEMNSSLDLPIVIQRIAVISSKNAAGYQDFMNELGKSPYRFTVELFDSFMQGNQTEESVIDALGRICDRCEDFDAVVMIRGGGAVSDLAAFDSYRLCCHVAQFPLPVVTGIGHERDRSVADMVANVSVKTPTAAAAFLNDSMAEVDAWLEQAGGDVRNCAVDYVQEQHGILTDAAMALSKVSSVLTTRVELKLERLRSEIVSRSFGLIEKMRSGLDAAMLRTADLPRRVIEREEARLERINQMAALSDPLRVLEKGYAVVRMNGKAVHSAGSLKSGDSVTIDFADGRVDAEIK